MPLIWTILLSDCNRIIESITYALPVLAYLMWTLHWSITELRTIVLEVRRLIVAQGGKHPCGSTSILYLPREKGGRGLRAVEDEYKVIKVKSALKLSTNRDSTIQMVRDFEQQAERRGHLSLVGDGKNFEEELGFTLKLNFLEESV